MIVRETIHHGDYRNVREQRIAPNFAGICDLLAASPYNGGKTLEQQAENKFVVRMAAKLLTTGRGEHGWATYEVIANTDEDRYSGGVLVFPSATTADEARDRAITWQHDSSQRSMTYGELATWQDYFQALADRFDLTDEFRENGIL
jgi:hypothetical protein